MRSGYSGDRDRADRDRWSSRERDNRDRRPSREREPDRDRRRRSRSAERPSSGSRGVSDVFRSAAPPAINLERLAGRY